MVHILHQIHADIYIFNKIFNEHKLDSCGRKSSWSEGQGCLETIVLLFLFIFFNELQFDGWPPISTWIRGGGGVPMRFYHFPHLFQCIFCILLPNMVLLSGPILYFHHSDVQGGVLELLHTHLGFIFLKVFPCLLEIIKSHIF
jgi:hypothetical protein